MVVRDFINMKNSSFGFNFDLNRALKQHGYTKTWKQREAFN